MRLTDKELEIMQVLWERGASMTTSDIITSSPNRTWKGSSIHVMLRTLQEKEAVVLEDFIPSTGRPSGIYKAALTLEEYVVLQMKGHCVDIGKLFAALTNDKEYGKVFRESGWHVEKRQPK